jgi:hypothetical protein
MKKRDLLSSISKAADVISRSSIRGSANYFVTSKENYEEFNKALRRHKRILKIKRIMK